MPYTPKKDVQWSVRKLRDQSGFLDEKTEHQANGHGYETEETQLPWGQLTEFREPFAHRLWSRGIG